MHAPPEAEVPGGLPVECEFATRSDEFHTRWAAHNVRLHDHNEKRVHHPVVGDITLSFEELPPRPTPA